MTPDVSIVIVTWKNSEFITGCLTSIERTKGNLKLEVIVVDNASSDGTIEKIRNLFPEVRLIMNSVNRGYSRGCNQGINIAKGEFILLLNPDVKLSEDSLVRLVEFAKTNPSIGAVGAQLLYPDGRIQPSCREFPTYEILLWEFLGLSRLFPKHRIFGRWKMGSFDHTSTKEVEQLMTSCLLVKREVVKTVGFMDEKFPIFYSDVDWCYRMKQRGYRLYFYPESKAYHFLGGSTKKLKWRLIPLLHKGVYDFLVKHDSGRFQVLRRLIFGIPLFFYAFPFLLFAPRFIRKFFFSSQSL